MRPIVLLLPKTSYRGDDLLAAAKKLGIPVIAASDRCHVLAEEWREGALPLEFTKASEAASALADAVRERRPLAVLGVDEQTALIAARASLLLGLPHNPIEAAEAARDKSASRARLAAAGVAVPPFEVVDRDLEPEQLRALAERIGTRSPALAGSLPLEPGPAGGAEEQREREDAGGPGYPCVLKPLALSGSRGVIRADDRASFTAAFLRLGALLRTPEVAARRDPQLGQILIEAFLPGPEVALEGLLAQGHLEVLALFDKPDPLEGPFFEETLYITPSRHPAGLQAEIAREVARAARALGLVEGPLHAELRLTPEGPRILEVAARSIGGLCGRTLRFGVGVSLEELVLRHALAAAFGQSGRLQLPAREAAAAGVMMLPIRQGGILQEVRGLEKARAVPLIEEVVITAHLQEALTPLPEGQSYLGFAFARGADPAAVEAALRESFRLLEVVVSPRLPIHLQP